MGTLWGQSNQLVFTNDGIIAPGAKAYFYQAGTSTPKTVYEDGGETTPHTHPVLADGNGRWPAVFVPFDAYKYIITTSGGSAIGDTIDDIPNEAPTDPTDSVDANAIFQTGDMIFVGANTTRAGFVRCNGRTIGSAASAATERANADTAALFAVIWNGYANGQAAVSGGRGASAAADYAANKTIALPDHRSAALIGFDDMGNSAAGLAGSAPVVSGSAILAGSIIGANTHTITTAQLASHSHVVGIVSGLGSGHTHAISITSGGASADHNHSGTTGIQSASHSHEYQGPPASQTGLFSGGGGNGWGGSPVAQNTALQNADHTHSFTTGGVSADHTHNVVGTTGADSGHTHNVNGTTGAEGSGSAHNIMSRSIPVTVLMKL